MRAVLMIKRKVRTLLINEWEALSLMVQSTSATEKSWQYPFKGDAAKGLWEHIEGHYNPSDHRVYAHYAAIVQSSGMGKSRTSDELAKEHFAVPLNLREATSTGAGLVFFSCLTHINFCIRISSC
jgi:hypothetical protein